MPPQSILVLPHSQALDWDSAVAPDGQTLHTASVAQRPLRDALNPKADASGPLGALGALARTVVPAAQPTIRVSDAAFKKLQQWQPIQQRVSKLIAHTPNNVFSIVASGGESFVRYEMRKSAGEAPPQYSIGAVRETISHGVGVCTDTNHALFTIIVAEENQRITASIAERAAGASSRLRELRPVSFAINSSPHGFVLWGDPRDPRHAPDVVVGDSWDALPVVKTWSNTAYADRPYTVKRQTVAGSSSAHGLSLREAAQIAAGPEKSAEVDAWLAAHQRPRIGDALLKQVYDICKEHNIRLSEATSFAQRWDVRYRNESNGDVFVPTIASHDYHRYRAATSNPAKIRMFRELTGAADGAT